MASIFSTISFYLAWLFIALAIWTVFEVPFKRMTGKIDSAKAKEDLGGGVIGGGLLAAILFGVSWYLAAPTEISAEEAALADAETTLADYKRMSAEDRGAFLARVLPSIAPEALDYQEQYRNCLGYNAPIKNEDLTAVKVLGWCDADRVNNPETFAGYFNDLEAKDHSAWALIHCRDRAKLDLTAPRTADFPFFSDAARHLGSWQYRVVENFESDNAFGVTFGFRLFCTIQFKGDGDPMEMRNWTISEFALQAE